MFRPAAGAGNGGSSCPNMLLDRPPGGAWMRVLEGRAVEAIPAAGGDAGVIAAAFWMSAIFWNFFSRMTN